MLAIEHPGDPVAGPHLDAMLEHVVNDLSVDPSVEDADAASGDVESPAVSELPTALGVERRAVEDQSRFVLVA
jgi:hypothetical protein